MRLCPVVNSVRKRMDRICVNDFCTVRRFEIELIASLDVGFRCVHRFDRVVVVPNPRDDADLESERLAPDFQ